MSNNASSSTLSIGRLVSRRAELSPEAFAIEALGRNSLSYGALWDHVEDVAKTLNECGVGHQDRVAIVLPNGPELATAFLAVASCAVSAPLNPSYSASELDFFLSDLGVKALILQVEDKSVAGDVARAHRIPILRLHPLSEGPAGMFKLESGEHLTLDDHVRSQPEDVALALHTSGTTSRPKIVPLSHRNLCTSAENVVRTLNLTPADRCLNVMPLFHIHGLVASVLASLAAGGSIVCTPGFYAPLFFDWIEAFRPTWYTAVPTIHQSIVARAANHRATIRANPLRFIRSSSAPLPPRVMAKLEEEFSTPVVEAYGMTEAAHQMASNPLPPRERKPGSVGLPAGPEVAIMSVDGRLCSPLKVGEIVIRGANVTAGYEGNPTANESAFTNDWFRTGDEGYVDEDGYLFITGRIKELINRGGEKIAPREVDEVLLSHPAVEQAVAFAVPDPHLGEAVAAAVVLNGGAPISEQQLRTYAATRLAPFKVPEQIIFLDEIPKGPTGKLQRIGLAQRLGIHSPVRGPTDRTPPTLPRTSLEKLLANLWAEVLRLDTLSVHDHFLDVGGDSMLATRLLSRIRDAVQVEVSMIDFFDAPTVADQADLIMNALEGGAAQTPKPTSEGAIRATLAP